MFCVYIFVLVFLVCLDKYLFARMCYVHVVKKYIPFSLLSCAHGLKALSLVNTFVSLTKMSPLYFVFL